MIFEPEKICRLAGSLRQKGKEPVHCGEGLWLLFLAQGRAAVSVQGPSPFVWQAGTFLLVQGPLSLTPTEPWQMEGVCLAGAASEQAAAGLAGPAVQAADRLPGLQQTLHRMTAGEARPDGCFALLCSLAAFDQAAAPQSRLAADAVAAVRRHYASLYGVQELADSLGVTKSHLVRSFHAATGQTPGQYLTGVRLAAAMQLLAEEPDCTLELVAQLCGFSSANYFCRVFREKNGCTLAVWRAQNAAGTGQGLVRDEIYL